METASAKESSTFARRPFRKLVLSDCVVSESTPLHGCIIPRCLLHLVRHPIQHKLHILHSLLWRKRQGGLRIFRQNHQQRSSQSLTLSLSDLPIPLEPSPLQLGHERKLDLFLHIVADGSFLAHVCRDLNTPVKVCRIERGISALRFDVKRMRRVGEEAFGGLEGCAVDGSRVGLVEIVQEGESTRGRRIAIGRRPIRGVFRRGSRFAGTLR